VATYVCDRLLFFKEGRVTTQLDDLVGLPYADDSYARDLLQAAHFLERPFAKHDAHAN
jgi:nickel transport system ATP-binding protein